MIKIALKAVTIMMVLRATVGNAVTIQWDPNEPAPDGYYIFQRLADAQYDYSAPIYIGDAVQHQVQNLASGQTYYFVVRAFVKEQTSEDSLEVQHTTPSNSPFVSFSLAADRRGLIPLNGQVVSDTIYIVADASSLAGTVEQVEFFLDDYGLANAPRQVERQLPYDFAGGGVNAGAAPFDTNTLENGKHYVAVRITMASGATSIYSAAFTVANYVVAPVVNIRITE